VWHEVRGHDQIAERFRRTIAANRLASSYLFVGPEGIGKRTFAMRLAEALLCTTNTDEALEACGQCDSCRLAASGGHPDLLYVCRPEEKSDVPLELLIGRQEHRMQEGLCHDIAMRPYLSRRKVAILDDADHLNIAGANCLLKTLEEPPAHSLLILISTSATRQLPTIRSRSQIIRFKPLVDADVAAVLADTQGLDADRAAKIAAGASGSITRAAQRSDDAMQSFRKRFCENLTVEPMPTSTIADQVKSLVDEAGREAIARRQRLREIFDLAIEFYRAQMRASSGAPSSETDMQADRVGAELAALRIECCLDAIDHLGRNANQTTLIEWWVSELARCQSMVIA